MSSTELLPLHGTPRRTFFWWAILMLATALTWGLGEAKGGPLVTAVLLAIAIAKGLVVGLDFMALRHAPFVWRMLIPFWLLLVCSLIGLAYWKGLSG